MEWLNRVPTGCEWVAGIIVGLATIGLITVSLTMCFAAAAVANEQNRRQRRREQKLQEAKHE